MWMVPIPFQEWNFALRLHGGTSTSPRLGLMQTTVFVLLCPGYTVSWLPRRQRSSSARSLPTGQTSEPGRGQKVQYSGSCSSWLCSIPSRSCAAVRLLSALYSHGLPASSASTAILIWMLQSKWSKTVSRLGLNCTLGALASTRFRVQT